MKSSTRDQAQGAIHAVKGAIKAKLGEMSQDPALESEGLDENLAGKMQKKIGQVKKVLGR